MALLKVNKKQFDLLTDNRREQFVSKMIEIICSEFDTAQHIQKATFKKSINSLINKAQSYGMASERSLALFVMTGYLLGEHFDTEFKAVQGFLPNKKLPENVKVDALEKWTKMIFESLNMEEC